MVRHGRRLLFILVIGLLLLNSSVVAAAVSTADIGDRTLRQGDTGEAVRALQVILGALGYSPGPVDGSFGVRTVNALRGLQLTLHLTGDGVVGPATRRGIESREYTVARGDMLSGLAVRFHSEVSWIVSANNLDNPDRIYPGQRLWMPLASPTGSAGSAGIDSQLLAGHHVIVDPGHGGANTGAIGVNGIKEKNTNLDIALRLAKLLRAAGATVTMTRSGDYVPTVPGYPNLGQLGSRTLIANRSGGEIFVSIHSNWYRDPGVSGLMSFVYPTASQAARTLAGYLYRETVASSGLRAAGQQTGDYHVVRETVMPAVLMELGFLSNHSDASLLATPAFRQQLANGLFRGIVDFYQNK